MFQGRELLRKDNLLDETASEDNKTVEEMSEDLQSSVRILQTRIARLTAEHTNTETKLQDRIIYLEKKLKKYGAEYDRQTQLFTSDEEEDEDGDDEHEEETPLDEHLIESERQKLLVKRKSEEDKTFDKITYLQVSKQ
uniref:Cyclic nucleotide-gated channel C-terminal leucine zipper domain-containing protein n=1 Tax=Ditylenchus dipsaci TaxID=166011 RepID=A0A915DPV8_9BILA